MRKAAAYAEEAEEEEAEDEERERNQEEVRELGGSISTMRQESGRVVSLHSQKGTKRDTWRAERREAPARLSMPTRRRLGGGMHGERKIRREGGE